jgi:hypothetical protein
MRQLSKRWEPLKPITGSILLRSFLVEIEHEPYDSLCWGCIEAKSLAGPFRLEIWNGLEGEWEFVQDFPTFKEAKAVGRLLAGVALTQHLR